jgi:UDP-N-acetylglucosamine/UDP-N-acetyl-alpha-D-glucosaminouronate 4-epimerase
MRRVLVTGGGGFIGSNLVRRLLEAGDDVVVLDNFSTGNRANLADVAGDVEIVEGELRSYERVHAATRGVEVVFHQGALPSVPRSVQDPLTTSAVNVEGTLNVLLAARDSGVRRIVAASSSSVYGNTGDLPRVETQHTDPISPYGVSKLAAERYCVAFSRVYDLETVALRYFNVFGPRQDPTSQYAAVVPRFISAVAEGRPVTINGDGTQSRDFTYVANVVDANVLAADADGVNGAVLNVATGRQATVNELAETIGEILGRAVEKEFLPDRAGDVRDSWADISAARRLLGFEPKVGLEEGLRRAAEALGYPPLASAARRNAV